MNPSTAFAAVLADELARCGLREVVVAPGSRSAPLAMAFGELERAGRVRLHVQDRRAVGVVHRARPRQGVPPAGRGGVHVGHRGGELPPGRHRGRRVRRPAARCSPPTGRPSCAAPGPARRSTRSSCTGRRSAGTPRPAFPSALPGMVGYWRSLACRAWAHAAGALGALPGPVHLNIPLRDPLVPDAAPGPLGVELPADWPELAGRAGARRRRRGRGSARPGPPSRNRWSCRGPSAA